MLKLKLVVYFILTSICLRAQSLEQFESLFKKEKDADQKAYYALVLNFDENPSEESLRFLKAQAKKSAKGKAFYKAYTIIVSVFKDENNAKIQDIIALKKEIKALGYEDLELTLSICEAYYYGINGDFAKASFLYDELYQSTKKNYLRKKKDYFSNINYNLLVFNISYHYFSVDDNQKALSYINDFISNTDIEKRPNEYAVLLTNIGSAFLSTNEYNKSLDYYSKAAKIYKKTKNYSELDWTLYCTAYAKLKMKNFDSALDLINALKIKKATKETEYEFVEWELVELIRAEIMLEKKEVNACEEILDRISTNFRNGILNNNDWSILYFLKYKMYKQKGNFKNALYFYEKHGELKDEFNEKKISENLNIQTKFLQLEKVKIKSEVEKKALNRENELHFQNELMLFALLAFIFIIIFYFLFRSIKVNKRLKKLNRINELNVNKVISSLSEKEVMIKEIHHRVKNNFQIISSLLNIQASAIDDPKYAEPLIEAKNRVHSMSLIHQKMYSLNNNYVSIDFNVYIEELLDSLLTSFGRDDLKLEKEIQIDKLKISLEKAVPIGLFCNEVFTNSYKYAVNEKNELKMEISIKKQAGNEVLLRIKDSGPGFSNNMNQKKSIGHQLKIILSEQLDAVLNEYNDNGAVVELKFKV